MPTKPVEAHRVVRRGEPRWRVIVPLELNGGVRRVRWFSSKSAATTYALELQSQRASPASEFLGLPPQGQTVLLRALQRLDGNADLLEEAVSNFLRSRPDETVDLGDAVEKCLASKSAAGLRPRSLQSLGSNLRQFALQVGRKPLSDVTSGDCERFVLAPSLARRTQRGRWIDLRTFFSFVLGRLWLRNSPLVMSKPIADEAPPAIMSVGEAERLLRATLEHDPKLAPYLALCMFGGLRPEAEAAGAEWSDVGEDHVTVPAVRSKTRRRRIVQMNATLRAWLALGGDLPVVNLVRRLRRVRRVAGIEWGHDCLRHSFVSYALPVWGGAQVAMWAGHSEAVLFAHYRELVTRQQADLWWGLTPGALGRNP